MGCGVSPGAVLLATMKKNDDLNNNVFKLSFNPYFTAFKLLYLRTLSETPLIDNGISKNDE